jgi:hypothetical protein
VNTLRVKSFLTTRPAPTVFVLCALLIAVQGLATWHTLDPAHDHHGVRCVHCAAADLSAMEPASGWVGPTLPPHATPATRFKISPCPRVIQQYAARAPPSRTFPT